MFLFSLVSQPIPRFPLSRIVYFHLLKHFYELFLILIPFYPLELSDTNKFVIK